MTRIIIAGGGLAGCLAALALSRRQDIDLLLVERESSFGGNHIWSFFDSDVAPGQRSQVDALVEWRWPDHDICFPGRRRSLPVGYNSLSSAALDRAVRSALHPDRYRLGSPVREVAPTRLILEGGEQLDADIVIDARGAARTDGLDLAWQKFVGRVYEFPDEHGVRRPIIMDATVEQNDGYRFLYFLPFGPRRLLIEDTYYSLSPLLDIPQIETRTDRAAARLDAGHFEVAGQESGMLPIVLGGAFDQLWPHDDQGPRLGIRGGFFHPTTSYSLPDAVANAALLADQVEFHPSNIGRLLRDRAERLWKERAFYRSLNRMLFHAAEPGSAYKVLEHFYRLPVEVISRFYAARLTALDKLRILSGKPPVPIVRALSALRGRTG